MVPVAKKRRNPDVEFLGEINVIPTLRTSWEDSLEKSLEWIEKGIFRRQVGWCVAAYGKRPRPPGFLILPDV